MARSPLFIIKEKKQGDEHIVFDIYADVEYAPNFPGIVLQRPFHLGQGTVQKNGWTINPKEGLTSPMYELLDALKLIDGIEKVEVYCYWMRIRIGTAFKNRVNSIILAVMDAIAKGWEGASFDGFSPYNPMHWKEFRFEATDMTFLPRLITTMFGESAGMVIPGTWDESDEGRAFVSGFKIDSIARAPQETDEWILEAMKSLGGETPELVIAACTTPWRINRTGTYEDEGSQFYGGRLHFDTKSGKGVIYDPKHN